MPTVSRMATYLGCLASLEQQRVSAVSSRELAQLAGVSPEQVRQDLALFGRFGKRGSGYDVARLREEVENIFRVDGERWVCCMVGAGSLGTALISSRMTQRWGFRYAAAFDSDAHKIGTHIGHVPVYHIDDAETQALKEISFDTISGAGPNGAVVHYRVSEETSRTLEPSSMYLVDSGGQYLDGTTDVTRTVWIGPGEPTAEMKDRFTRVLKGHIALARAVFPAGTRGTQLDTLARQFLWAAGVDYAHGTGHGVGSFLAVHEGPQRIATSAGGQAGTEEPLAAGMFISNEPGYYKTGEYGIRIENLILVEPREIAGAEGEYLGFETLTYAPIERALVDTNLMTRDELRWWDEYHAKVLEIVGPQLEGEVKAWLEAACAPLSRG